MHVTTLQSVNVLEKVLFFLKVNKLHKYSKQKITYATMKKEVLKLFCG